MSTTPTTATAGVAPPPVLLEVDDLVQRYTLPRENLFRAGGQVVWTSSSPKPIETELPKTWKRITGY